jgi:hypothetical protein
MPAPPLSNNFEGGTQGNTIATTDTGSGDAWSVVSIGASATLTYDNTHAHSGTLAAKYVEPATSVNILLEWTGLGSIVTSVYHRIYLYMTAYPAANLWWLRVNNSAGTTSCQIGMDSSGHMLARNAASGAIAALAGTVAVALNKWVRLEARCVSSTTVGELEWRLFNTADSTTADETKNATAQVFASDTDRSLMGTIASPVSYTWWMDDLAVATDGWIGPLAAPPGVRTFNPIPFQAQGRNL